MKTYVSFAIASVIGVAAATGAAAQSITPTNAGQVASPIVVVNNGPNDQVEPRVSNNLVSYADFSSGTGRVHYFNFLTSTDAAIPIGPGEVDTLAATDGTRISFSRQSADRRAVLVFDTVTSTLTEIDPQPGSARFSSAIGGNRVAFLDTSSSSGDIMVYDLLGQTTTNLSLSAGDINGNPGIAPDGNTVVWERCDIHFIFCDVHAAVWDGNASAWTAFTVATTPGFVTLNPHTDGDWIVYDSNRPSATADDIYFKPIAGDGIERQLAIPALQRHPTISQGVIAFESKETPITPADLFVYVMATNSLYQVTSTPLIDESLSDVSVLPNGDIRVVWNANDGPGGEMNVYATTFTPAGVHYQVCLLYDPLVAKKAGAAYPIKLQLCDGNGHNLSSASVPVHAVSVTRVSNNAPGPLDSTGNANPDFDFRYDSTLAGYVFNLSTKGFATGTYSLNFTAGADATVHSATFAVK